MYYREAKEIHTCYRQPIISCKQQDEIVNGTAVILANCINSTNKCGSVERIITNYFTYYIIEQTTIQIC
jgi:hypothetical protein